MDKGEKSNIENNIEAKPGETKAVKKPRRRWPKILLRIFVCIFVLVLLIPVLIYLPPVQSFLKDVASDMVYKSTGMKIGIGEFRLRFPVDVTLGDVYVLETTGDTMASVREAEIDVRLLPLFSLDVQLKKLLLKDGLYNMLSADSSMTLSVRAKRLEADGGSSVNIRNSEINLNKVLLSGGDVRLYMNVWKQKEQPQDSAASTPFLIRAKELRLEDFRFAMSMLPTIDTLTIDARKGMLRDGIINLRTNTIDAGLLSLDGGKAVYLTPTPEYIKTHPAPPPLPSTGPPMVIQGDSVSLLNFSALYATKGVKPMPGFDASYIQADDINLGLRGFYNRSSEIRLPVTRMEAKERSGLQIVSGSGTLGVDSVGLTLDDFKVRTPFSSLSADADVSFGMMALDLQSPMRVNADMSIGIPDIISFMPSLGQWVKVLPTRQPLTAILDASGSLSSLDVPKLQVDVPGLLSLKASGVVDNPMDMKKIRGKLNLDGQVKNAMPLLKVAGVKDIAVPPLSLRGNATVNGGNYAADFRLLSPAGNVSAKGKVAMNAETYSADVNIGGLDVRRFMPSLGVGTVTASLSARGAGFNPTLPRASTDVSLRVDHLQYQHMNLHDITADVTLHNGNYTIYLDSRSEGLVAEISGNGTIAPDDYSFDLRADLIDVDLKSFGLSEIYNGGAAEILLSGTASPGRGLYDVTLSVDNVDWALGDNVIRLPGGLDADFIAQSEHVSLNADAVGISLGFNAESGLDRLLSDFTAASEIINRQIAAKRLDVDSLKNALPLFDLDLTASGKGAMGKFLAMQQMNADSLFVHFENKDMLRGNLGLRGLVTSSLQIDTVNFNIAQRDNLLDYTTHIGNRPTTMDGEFASVDLNGYVGGNRASLYMKQQNSKGETGYRLGLTAAFLDEAVSLHFTPLKATIGYLPWTFNDDNYVEYSYNNRIDANLVAYSNESSIMLRTEQNEDGQDQLRVKLKDIHIQDFLGMSVTAPPIKGTLNSEMLVAYTDAAFTGSGNMTFSDFYYQKQRVGDFGLDFKAALRDNGDTGIKSDFIVNGQKVMTAAGIMRADTVGGKAPIQAGVSLTKFPLNIANAFLDGTANVQGSLSGNLRMEGTLTDPKLNGKMMCDSVSVFIPMIGATLRFPSTPLNLVDNVLEFNKYSILAANENPLVVDGTVDARKLTAVALDLSLNADRFMLMNSKKKPGSDMYGKLLLNLSASAKGKLSQLDVKANLGILQGTDVFYTVPAATAEIAQTSSQNIVKFVQFSDTTAMNAVDTVASSVNMRITAGLTISNGVQATVNLSPNGTDKVQLSPTGSLNYFQNYMGDMRLTGQLVLGNGFARYSIPMIGEKMFTFEPDSYVLWNGAVMNPVLNIRGVDLIKSVVKDDSGNSRLVDFLVSLSVTNNLEHPKVVFDLSTDDDLTIQNELQSMSADQRSAQAMNLLLYGSYSSGNSKTTMGGADDALYSFLESRLNSWAANNIRGVDLSFGIDQYDQTVNGRNSSSMTYSYQVSKSLFDNRFKIVVGGNYSTDPTVDESFAESMFSDVSFEYMLKQTNTLSMYVKLFRHTGFESVLEGEVTEMGVGFVMRRKLGNLRRLFNFLRRKRNRGERVISAPDEVSDTVRSVSGNDNFYKIELPAGNAEGKEIENHVER